MSKVRGWVMLEPGKMEMQKFDLPKIPEDSALLKVEACGLCGSDLHAFRGRMKTAPFPLIPGHEFIGTLVEVGKTASEKMAIVGGGTIKGSEFPGLRPLLVLSAYAPSALPLHHPHHLRL